MARPPEAHPTSDSPAASLQRIAFTIPQVDALENYFNNTNASPDKTEIAQLLAQGGTLQGVTPDKLSIWFKNSRAKFNKNTGHTGGMLGPARNQVKISAVEREKPLDFEELETSSSSQDMWDKSDIMLNCIEQAMQSGAHLSTPFANRYREAVAQDQ